MKSNTTIGLTCTMCNRRVPNLVPLYDNDQQHKNTQCCVDCKRKIRKGEKIVKFQRREEENGN